MSVVNKILDNQINWSEPPPIKHNNQNINITISTGARAYVDKNGDNKNAFDNVVKPASLPWSELVDLFLKPPTTTLLKEEAYMLNGWLYKTATDADTVFTDVNFHNPVQHVRKVKSNLKTVSLLIIDYDGKEAGSPSFDQWCANNKQYTFIAHTTHSHTGLGEYDRFRVVIPLTTTVGLAAWESRIKGLREYWPGCDFSSFDANRSFFLPHIKEEFKTAYKIFTNVGKSFDVLEKITPPVKIVQQPRPLQPTTGEKNGSGEIIWGTVDVPSLLNAANLNPRSANGQRTLIDCPWGHLHSDGNTEAAIFTGGDRTGFNCFHSSCADKTIKDVYAEIGYDLVRQHAETVVHEQTKPLVLRSATVNTVKEIEPEKNIVIEGVYDEKWCRSLLIEHGTHFIRSPKGSGKTTALVECVNIHKKAGRSVIVIGHRSLLLKATAKKLELAYYRDINGQIDNTHVCICLNSLTRLNNHLQDNKYDVVILDESNQLLEAWASGGVRSEGTISASLRPKISKIFVDIVESARYVYALDADLDDLSTRIIGGLRQTMPFYISDNEYTEAGRTCTVYVSRGALINDMLRCAKAGIPFFVGTNNKKQNSILKERLEEAISTVPGLVLPVYDINADNVREAAHEELLNTLTNKKAVVIPHILITSPSVSTGYDLVCDVYDAVFGIFDVGRSTHQDIGQHLSRVRGVKDWNVFIQAGKTVPNDEHYWEQWYFDIEAASAVVAGENAVDGILDKNSTWYTTLTHCKTFCLAKNTSLAPKRPFISNILASGCKIRNNKIVGAEISKKKVSRIELKALLCAAESIEYEARADYSGTYEALRATIEYHFGCVEKNDGEAVDWYMDRRQHLKSYKLLMMSYDEAERLDVIGQRAHVIDRVNMVKAKELQDEILNILEIKKDGNMADICISADDKNVEKLLSFCVENSDKINKYLGRIRVQSGKKKMTIISGLLSTAGIPTNKLSRKQINGVRCRVMTVNIEIWHWCGKYNKTA